MIKKLLNWKLGSFYVKLLLKLKPSDFKRVHKIGLENTYIPEAAEELLDKSLSFVPSCKNKRNRNIMENWKAFERNVKLRKHF